MSFQWIFDRAETISINKRAVVAQTITRNNAVRTVKLGGQTWRFDVKLPDGLRWSDIRGLIESMEALGRSTASRVYLNQPGHRYISGYQGGANIGSIQMTYNSDSLPTTLNMSSVSSLNSEDYIFKTGDWLQLGTTGKTYSVVGDVVRGNANIANVTVTVNRPIVETANVSAVYNVLVGQEVSWEVICVEMPQWTLFGHDQVSWNGNFVFYEVV